MAKFDRNALAKLLAKADRYAPNGNAMEAFVSSAEHGDLWGEAEDDRVLFGKRAAVAIANVVIAAWEEFERRGLEVDHRMWDSLQDASRGELAAHQMVAARAYDSEVRLGMRGVEFDFVAAQRPVNEDSLADLREVETRYNLERAAARAVWFAAQVASGSWSTVNLGKSLESMADAIVLTGEDPAAARARVMRAFLQALEAA